MLVFALAIAHQFITVTDHAPATILAFWRPHHEEGRRSVHKGNLVVEPATNLVALQEASGKIRASSHLQTLNGNVKLICKACRHCRPIPGVAL